MSDSEKSARYNWLDRSAVRVRFDARPYEARANPGFDPLKNDWIITKKSRINLLFVVNGGAEGDRTLDLLIANQSLSQLSYSPIFYSGTESDFQSPCVPMLRRGCCRCPCSDKDIKTLQIKTIYRFYLAAPTELQPQTKFYK